MELLVVTLAHTMVDKEADGLARIHLISDTVRNAPGLVTSRFYRSRGQNRTISCSPPGKMRRVGRKHRNDIIPSNSYWGLLWSY